MHLSIIVLLILAFPATLLAQQSPAPASTSRTLSVERLRDDAQPFTSYSGIDDSLRIVVRDEASWRGVWQKIHRRMVPVPPIPPVDFKREMVIVAAMGQRPSGGFAIRVDSAMDLGDSLEIVVRTEIPGRGCLRSAAITQPLDLVRLPARPLPVRFRDHSVVEQCD